MFGIPTSPSMIHFTELFVVFGPILAGVMVGGTAMTILVIFYRQRFFNGYLELRSFWHRRRKWMPERLRTLVRWFLGATGVLLVLLGMVLMPLPGPGSLVVLGAAALLDLEFGWVVPVLKQVVRRCPDRVLPSVFRGGLKRLNELND